MKKLLLVLVLLICGVLVWAQEDAQTAGNYALSKEETALVADLEKEIDDITGRFGKQVNAQAENQGEDQTDVSQSAEKPENIPSPLKEEKKRFRMKNRGFEIALLNTSIGFNNSFLTVKDTFQKTMVINLNDLSNGLQLGFGAYIAPIAININWKDKWGFGFDLGTVSASGNANITGKLLQIQLAEKEKFGAGAALFADVGIPTFFHIRKLKVKLRPAVYLPVAYTEPGVYYTLTEKTDSIYAALTYDMYVYSPISLDGIESGDIEIKQILKALNTTTFGFDFNAGMEFPLFSFLDAGVDIQNIPLKASILKHYMRIKGEAYIDTSVIDIGDLITGGDFPDDLYGYPKKFEMDYGKCNRKILLPFKFVTYTVYRPFNRPIFTLLPVLGFALNPLYPQPFSLETGIKARLDLANMFTTTVGVNFEDQMWKNSLNFVINLRALELDFGVAFMSTNFVKSWQGAGANVNFGLKLGW